MKNTTEAIIVFIFFAALSTFVGSLAMFYFFIAFLIAVAVKLNRWRGVACQIFREETGRLLR